ncbi:alpha-L-rhamnosidase N-terminal domain-containing protein [Kouleothrix sp.]|uniref:alpha-L-rhamnosidase-related protein n=1 Tax=Kouleothrix sp. TaxID=2779161 RepID=UPI00391BE8B3
MIPANQNLAPPQAFWIGSDHPFDLHEAYLCFRGSLTLAQQPERAPLHISADSRFRLWVNGQPAARGPARGYPHAQVVDCVDVAGLLRAGPNTIAAQVYQPGYSHFAYVHRAAAGLLAWLECDGTAALATDTGWRTRRDRSFGALVPRVSIYGSGVEERDMALDEPWQQPEYDASGWAMARVVALAGGYPWTATQPRALPPLAERELPLTLLAARRGSYPAELAHDAHAALRAGWQQARPVAPAATRDGWFDVVLSAGTAVYWLFELGRGYTCQGWAEVQGARGGELLSVSYLDKLHDHHRGTADAERPEHTHLGALSAAVVNNSAEPVISDPATYCRVRLTDRFRLRPGAQQAETFALRGGRLVLFQLAAPGGGALRLRFHVRASEYPLEVARRPEPADPLLARVAAMCENTLRACLADGFVDCAWRESSQWLGDALPQALIMSALSDDTRPLRRTIELAAQGAYADGVLPGVLPSEAHAYTVVDYNFVWVELLRLYHTLTGDQQFVAGMWPTLAALLERFHRDVNADGLLISQPGRRLFLDWGPLARGEPSAVYNLHYLLALRCAIALAEALIGHQDAKARRFAGQASSELARTSPDESWSLGALAAEPLARWRARANALSAAARAAFWDGERWHDDLARTTCSQLAAALAIVAGAALPGEWPALLDAIAARSLDVRDEHRPGEIVLASPFMHHYLFEALRRGGRGADVLEIIRRRWGRWAGAGEPTTWENWNVDFADGSRCHAFSAHPLYHLAEVARARGGL